MKNKRKCISLKDFPHGSCRLCGASMIDEGMNASPHWLHIQTWLTDCLYTQDGLQRHTWLTETKLHEKAIGPRMPSARSILFGLVVFPLSFLFRSDYHSPLILHVINSHHLFAPTSENSSLSPVCFPHTVFTGLFWSLAEEHKHFSISLLH